MESLSFKPKSISVTAGEVVRFILRNTGDIPHEFTIGTPLVQAGRRAVMRELFDADILQEYLADAPPRDGPNSMVILGGETRELMWTFTETQEIEFGCNLPLHYEAGMRGDIHVHVPGKGDEVAADSHGHAPQGTTGTASAPAGAGGLAGLAQLMAKAKQANEEDVGSSNATEAEPGKTKVKAAPAEQNAAGDQIATVGQADPSDGAGVREAENAPASNRVKLAAKDAVAKSVTVQPVTAKPVTAKPKAAASDAVSVTEPDGLAFDRGLALLRKGDIVAARAEFEKSTTAESALALGRTYDEKYLSGIDAPNAGPDAAAARRWYEAWYRISVKQGAISAETNLDLLIEAIAND